MIHFSCSPNCVVFTVLTAWELTATGDTSSCASVGTDPVSGDVSSLVQVRQK